MKIELDKVIGIYGANKGKKKILLTENLTPGKKYFDEDLIIYKRKEYRVFDPRRSKLAATILKGSPNIGFRKGDVVLYLGCSHGYTVSYVSDIVGREGFVFAIDIAPIVMRHLIFSCKQRNNIAPILADSNKPLDYVDKISKVNIIYQDIAQKNQVGIFLKNIDLFLKNDGYAMLAVKARSIDISKKPRDIFKEVKKELEKTLIIIDFRILDPIQRDHCFFICKKNK